VGPVFPYLTKYLGQGQREKGREGREKEEKKRSGREGKRRRRG
jgi:hypothetical protein